MELPSATASRESAPLMAAEEKRLYVGEKEPGMKAADVAGKGEPQAVKYDASTGAAVPTLPPAAWKTGLFSFCNTADEQWLSTDSEICILGTFAPCFLYGSTRERLEPAPQQFRNSSRLYLGLCILGKLLLKGNFIAPCFTFPTRTAIRQKYNLQGNQESLQYATGCFGASSPEEKEAIEGYLDCLLHWACHPCALCQEAREVRRQEVAPYVASASPLAAPGVQVITTC